MSELLDFIFSRFSKNCTKFLVPLVGCVGLDFDVLGEEKFFLSCWSSVFFVDDVVVLVVDEMHLLFLVLVDFWCRFSCF